MKDLMRKGLSTLPVVNEMLLCVVLIYEVVQRLKNRYVKKSSTTADKESGKQ